MCMKAALLASLLILASLAFADGNASQNASNGSNATAPLYPKIDRLAPFLVPIGGQYNITSFPFNNSTALALVSPGSQEEVYGIFFPGESALTSEQDLGAALESYYASRGYSDSLGPITGSVHPGIEQANGSRVAGQVECRRLLGTGTWPCDSYDSCRFACFSVTSFCQNFLYGGPPGQFVYVIWAFENNTRSLDAAYANESAAYGALLNNASRENYEAYLASISGINRAATRASDADLFTLYSFCYEPDYALPLITNLQLQAQGAYQNFYVMSYLPQRAALIHNATLLALVSRDNLDAALERQRNLTMQAANNSSMTNASLPQNQSVAPQASQQAPQSIVPAAAFLLFLFALCAIVYWLRIRKRLPQGGKEGAPEDSRPAGERTKKKRP
jgi:hypothetical protein